MTSIGSVMADLSHVSTLHLVTAYLGVLIGRARPLPSNLLLPCMCRS